MQPILIANAGVPMLLVYGPVLLIALLPIVLIETAIIDRKARVGYLKMGRRVLVANAVSTLAGVPITWVALVLLQMLTGGGTAHGVGLHAVTWQAPWLIPYEDDLNWMVPAAALVLTLPFWFVSVLIERSVLVRLCRNVLGPDGRADSGVSIRRLCLIANTWTYALLAMFWGGLFVLERLSGA